MSISLFLYLYLIYIAYILMTIQIFNFFFIIIEKGLSKSFNLKKPKDNLNFNSEI